jgi:HSP20 family protein
MMESAARDYFPFIQFNDGELVPALDVEETENAYRVTMPMPGVKAEDIDINLHDGVLTIGGEIKEEKREEKGKMLVQERRYGRFSRSVRFPMSVNPDSVEAEYKDGTLKLTVAKAAEAQPRKIAIKTNGNK